MSGLADISVFGFDLGIDEYAKKNIGDSLRGHVNREVGF